MSDVAEASVKASCSARDFTTATRDAVIAYGEEIYSFVLVRLRDEDVAGDVFAQACEDLITTLPAFEWRCSLRTWFYRLARSAAARYLRSPSNRSDRRVALSEVSEVAAQVRSRTVAHLRSEVKDGVRALRDRLDPDEQQLLMLRIDRDLAWDEIAEILADGDLDASELQRASARLRQQFQKLKDRLRDLAIAEGLLDG
jgi:RNA polymerase sigma-70 factor (ECF subfamily)